MHFLIVGPGAMGCLFAAGLKACGEEVTLFDCDPERAAHIARDGVHVEGVTGTYSVQVPIRTIPPETPPETVLMCVKAYQTREAAEPLREWLPAETVLLTLQNGLGNLETLQELFGKDRVLGGITSEGATVLGAGRIRHAGRGQTMIGPRSLANGAAEPIAQALSRGGFETQCVDDVTGLIWGKLIINVGINALTAITRLRNGRLPDVPGTREILTDAVSEAVAVAHAKGIQLPYPDPVGRVVEVCRSTSENIASMLQDVLHERMTEVETINQAIVREAQSLDLPAPVNHTLTRLVQAIQETYEDRVSGTD